MDIFSSYYIPEIDAASPAVQSRKRAKENARLVSQFKEEQSFLKQFQEVRALPLPTGATDPSPPRSCPTRSRLGLLTTRSSFLCDSSVWALCPLCSVV